MVFFGHLKHFKHMFLNTLLNTTSFIKCGCTHYAETTFKTCINSPVKGMGCLFEGSQYEKFFQFTFQLFSKEGVATTY